MELSPQSIKPLFKRSLHVGCNKYEDVQMSNLTQARKDAQKVHDLCKLEENEFDAVVKMSDFSASYLRFFPELITSLDKLIYFAEGTAQKKPPQYKFNFISFSCHGVMCENQTFAVIPYKNQETNAFEKQYINITAYAKKLAAIKNTFNIILFDGCRNVIKKEDLVIKEEEKGTMKERSNANLLKAAQEENQQRTYHGYTLVIYSTKENTISSEGADGGCGTNLFLEKVKANIENGNKSYEFADSYGETFIERFTEIPRDQWKKIIMFSNYPLEKLLKQLDDDKESLYQQVTQTQDFDQIKQLLYSCFNNLMSYYTFSGPYGETMGYQYAGTQLESNLKPFGYKKVIDDVFTWMRNNITQSIQVEPSKIDPKQEEEEKKEKQEQEEEVKEIINIQLQGTPPKPEIAKYFIQPHLSQIDIPSGDNHTIKKSKSIQQPLEDSISILKKLNDQKQALLKQLETSKGYDRQSNLIGQFLNNIMSETKFSDPNDEVEAKSYVNCVPIKLKTQGPLKLINEAFDWIFTHQAKKQIYSKPSQIKTIEKFNDEGRCNTTIIKANNGKVIQGEEDKQLYVIGSDLKQLLKTIPISHWLMSGMAIGNRLFCGQGDDKVTVFDEDTLALIQTIKTQSLVKTMLLIQDDYLLIGQWQGYIDIIQISTLSIIFSHQLLQQATIFHVIKTSNLNEYAIALFKKGIVIVNIERDDNNKFTLIENTTEYYFQHEDVLQIAEVQSNILIACVGEMKDLQVIDRKSKQVIATIPNASIDGSYNSLQKVIGYDDETFPQLLLKDKHKISVIDAKKYTAVDIIESQYDAYVFPQSMVQYQVNNELRLLTLYWNKETNARSTKEFVIGSL